jgi:hypothetical protein
MSATTARSTRHGVKAQLVALVTVSALLAGCHIQTRVALPGDSPPTGTVPAATVKAGDEVRIVMRDGTLVGATVVTAQPDALVASGGRRYPYAEMATLEIRALSVGRSAGVVAGVIAGTWALFTLLLLAAGWEADG